MPVPLTHSAAFKEFPPAASRLQRDCQSCGFQNLEVDVRCQKCGRRLQPVSPPAMPQASRACEPPPAAPPETVVPPAPALPAIPEHVRQEIHARVERFKARRRGQTMPLPFDEPVLEEAGNIVAFPSLEPEPVIKRSRNRARPEPQSAMPCAAAVESAGSALAAGDSAREPGNATSTSAETQEPPSLPADSAHAASDPFQDFVAARAQQAPDAPVEAPPQFTLFATPVDELGNEWQNFRIASLRKRLSGIGHDLSRILGGITLFAAPFYWIAGPPPLTLHLLAAFVAGSLLIALMYGTLFLTVAGQTPGMGSAGLRIVSFNGQRATRQQLLLRVAGALVSAGSFLCGYLWACVDEEKLYWHDHISKTVLTDSAE